MKSATYCSPTWHPTSVDECSSEYHGPFSGELTPAYQSAHGQNEGRELPVPTPLTCNNASHPYRPSFLTHLAPIFPSSGLTAGSYSSQRYLHHPRKTTHSQPIVTEAS